MVIGIFMIVGTGIGDTLFFVTEQHREITANIDFSDIPFDADTVITWSTAPDVITKLFNEDETSHHFYPLVHVTAFRFIVKLSDLIREENVDISAISTYAGYMLHYIGDASCITHYAGSGGKYNKHVLNEFFSGSEHHDIESRQQIFEIPVTSRSWNDDIDMWEEILSLEGRTRSRAIKAREHIDNNGLDVYLDSDLFIRQTNAQLQDAIDLSNLALHASYYKTSEELNRNYIVIGDYPFHLGVIKFVPYTLGGLLIIVGYLLQKRGVK